MDFDNFMDRAGSILMLALGVTAVTGLATIVFGGLYYAVTHR